MNSKKSSLLRLGILLTVCSAIQALDITKLLTQYPELGLFNQYLTETKLADQINGRQTITVLAIDNSTLSGISAKSKDTIKAILSTHVILDYYDEKKLASTAQAQHNQLTTLYQASGLANKLQGFIKVAIIGEGEIAFGSAVNGAPLDAQLVTTVTTRPYNISVLQVSQPIIVPGIDGNNAQSPPSSSPKPKAKSPAPSKKPVSPAPSPSDEAYAPEEPEGPSPATAPAHAADKDTPAAPSSSIRTQMGLVGAVMVLASLLAAL